MYGFIDRLIYIEYIVSIHLILKTINVMTGYYHLFVLVNKRKAFHNYLIIISIKFDYIFRDNFINNEI